MKKYDTKDIRDVALVGHQKCGKTSLGEAFLFDAKMVTRQGKVDDETSNLDAEPEEIKRKSSIQCHLGYCEWKKRKVNVVDTPGDANFAGEAELGISAADAALVVVSAPDGVQVGTERAWDMIDRHELPRVVFINKLDRERANFDRTMAEIKEILSDKAVALQLPMGQEAAFCGVVDLLSLKSYTFEGNGREVTAGDVPDEMTDAASAAREELIECIASADDELIEKYLDEGELSEEEINAGLAKGIASGDVIPVLCGSATRNIGVQPVLDMIVNCFPSPDQGQLRKASAGDGSEVEVKADADAPLAAFVFKTMSADVGKIALLRVVAGTVTPDTTVANPTRRGKERIGQIYALQGKKRDSMEQAVAGDLVGLAKLKDTRTGDTLTEEKSDLTFTPPPMPDTVISFSVRPKSKGDEEKVATRLSDILQEDVSLKLSRDQLTKEMLLSGLGLIHIETTVEKLRRMGVEVELADPKVPYRETIKGKAVDIEGKHKKQTGGRGQFGFCVITMEPKPPAETDADDPLEFVDEIKGGSIPKQFIPAVEKGIRVRMAMGVIAGYPVVNIRVRLTFGKFHAVDSDGRSFEMAGSKGFQNAIKAATPILLEPIMNMEIVCPEENMGDIIGDVSSRRGKVLGTEAKGRRQIIKAQVPLAEVLRYAIDLESITAGRGAFSMSQSHYDEMPSNLAEKIIASSNLAEEED